jgi:branched-chain amino acid transport system permease protein
MRDAQARLRVEFRASLVLLALIAMLPLAVTNIYWLGVLIVAMYYTMLACGWNLLVGYTGQMSLAPACFGMLGAYTTGMLWHYHQTLPVFGIGAAILLTAAVGYVLGRIVLRLRGAYVALTTLAFAEITRLLIFNSYGITRGDLGLRVTPILADRVHYFYLFLAAVVLTQVFLYALLRSRAGLYLLAIRDDETAARSRGVDVVFWKTMAFTIAAAISGLAGALYAHFAQLISPELGLILNTGIVIAMAVIGGMGSLVGPIIGGFLVWIASEWLRDFGGWHLVIFAALIVVFGRFFRDGLWGLALLAWSRLRPARPAAEKVAAP